MIFPFFSNFFRLFLLSKRFLLSFAISSQHKIMFCMYINVGCDEEFMI